MTQQTQGESLSPEQIAEKSKQWMQQELVKIQKYCSSQGIQFKALKQDLCQSLPPIVAVWYAKSTTKNENYWLISGEVPTDLAPSNVAKNAREALRYFSMNWQLKVANLEDSMAQGKIQLSDRETQQKYADSLAQKAEALYKIYQDDKLWEGTGLKAS